MAQLKDLLVTGASRLIGDAYANTIQITSLNAPTSAGGSTYGTGSNGQVLLSNGSSIYWGSAAPTVTESTVSGWGFTKNTGTITGATANKGLTVSGTTLGHSNSVTAQTTQAIYPIKIDAQGHISAYGTAVTPLTASSTLDATKLSGTIPASCYTNTWTAMVGATASANGSVGYVNAAPPKDGYNTKYLRADGTWQVPPDTHHTAYLRAGASGGTANAATTTGNTYLNLVENNTNRSGVKLVPGSNMSIISDANGNVTFTATDTTYSSLAAASGGTAVSLVTTGEKYTWNNKLSSHQTIKQDGMTGATVNRYGTCTTATGTVQKDVTLISGGGTFSLETGATVRVKFTNYNSVANPTLKVGSTDAKPIMMYGTTTASTNANTSWESGEIVTFTYDGTNWLMADFASRRNDNTIPSAYCSTTADTAAKTASCSGYALLSKSYIHVIITNSNTAQAALTLNINSKGAKPIYINGTASSSSNYTLPAGPYLVYYNGTNYYFRTDGKLTADITGNAATATKATQDASGNTITSTYLAKSEIGKSSNVSITFSNSDTATVSVTGVTASNTIIVSPTPEEWQNWGDYGIRCSAQASGSLTFTASNAIDLTTAANIVILP